jgi:hypothetical protein
MSIDRIEDHAIPRARFRLALVPVVHEDQVGRTIHRAHRLERRPTPCGFGPDRCDVGFQLVARYCRYLTPGVIRQVALRILNRD